MLGEKLCTPLPPFPLVVPAVAFPGIVPRFFLQKSSLSLWGIRGFPWALVLFLSLQALARAAALCCLCGELPVLLQGKGGAKGAAPSHSFWDQQGAHRVQLGALGSHCAIPGWNSPAMLSLYPVGLGTGSWPGAKGSGAAAHVLPMPARPWLLPPRCLIPTASDHRKSNQKQWGSSSVLSSSKSCPQICWISTKIGTEQFLFYRASSSAPCSCGPLPGHAES